MRTRILLILTLCVSVFAVSVHAEPLAGKRPNIIFILTDDQGHGDLSVHGNPILKTPHLDKMHGESVRFTNWHNSPTCSPTRSALLTGRHEFRNGVTHTILERERLTLKSTTIAQVLKGAGYGTGIFGKWHLGDEEEYRPDERGFDEMFIHGAGGIGQSYPGSCGDAPGNKYFDPAILHNGKFVKTKGYCTDVFFDQATKWIGQRKDGKEPFFCWLATNAPHGPYIARPEDRALYEGKDLGPESVN
jgi:arylsulfatase